MKLNIPELNSNLFDYNGDGVFLAEASELPSNFIARVYDDACDVGFEMVSAKTGNKALFLLDDIVEDAEGDLLCWNLVCADKKLGDLKAVIFND